MRDLLTSWVLAIALMAPTAPTASATRTSEADASTLDERVNHLASELRCLVCQNQTVADSHAPLAVQLKQEVRKQLAAGASDDEVREFMVQRYGDFVLYRPPVHAGTLALWLGPAVILLSGLVGLAMVLRKRRLLGDGLQDDGDDNSNTNETTGQPAQADGRETA